jgi:hypothetical protein
LGDTIRLYLKRIYEFPALEMTTREIHEELKKELAPSEIITITKKVLNEADIVKFANFHPGTEQAASVYNRAKQFIETAEVVNYEQIKYMKYKYEVKHGIIKDQKLTEASEQKTLHYDLGQPGIFLASYTDTVVYRIPAVDLFFQKKCRPYLFFGHAPEKSSGELPLHAYMGHPPVLHCRLYFNDCGNGPASAYKIHR